MKHIIIPGITTLFLAVSVIAACTPNQQLPDGVNIIEPRQHTCQELRSMVSSQPRSLVSGIFGPVSVLSNRRACGFKRQAVPITWRTSDTLFCTAGFTCKAYFNDDDDDR